MRGRFAEAWGLAVGILVVIAVQSAGVAAAPEMYPMGESEIAASWTNWYAGRGGPDATAIALRPIHAEHGCTPGGFTAEEDPARFVYDDPLERRTCGALVLPLPAIGLYETVRVSFGLEITFSVGDIEDVDIKASIHDIAYNESIEETGLGSGDGPPPSSPSTTGVTYQLQQELSITGHLRNFQERDGLEVHWKMTDRTGRVAFEAVLHSVDVDIRGPLMPGEQEFGAYDRPHPEFDPGPRWHVGGPVGTMLTDIAQNWSVGRSWLDPTVVMAIPAYRVPYELTRDGETVEQWSSDELEVVTSVRWLRVDPHLSSGTEQRLVLYNLVVSANTTVVEPGGPDTDGSVAQIFRIGPLPTSLILALPAVAALPGVINIAGRSLDRHGMVRWRRVYGLWVLLLVVIWAAVGWALGIRPLMEGGLVWPPDLRGGILLLVILALVAAFLAVWAFSERARRSGQGRP